MFLLTNSLRRKNYIMLLVISIENLKILKYHTFPKNTSFFYYFQEVKE